MGEQRITPELDGERLRAFLKHLLADLRALEQMLDEGLIESDIRRVGAEQECVLVDKHQQPAPVAIEVLERLDDAHFTTELAKFNIEYNLDPVVFKADCLGVLEKQLNDAMAKAQEAAAEFGADVVLTGILPTLRKSHLTLDYMTPRPRYYALNDALTRLRGGDYELRFTGTDELIVKHDSVMLESCNTSFQVHFQVHPDEFARWYNIAQAVAAPVLAAGVNSPLFFGKRLWRETRIGLFQQAVDTRSSGAHADKRQARVSFGESWANTSALEIFREDIARFRVLLGIEISEDPFEVLASGKAPELHALRTHNSTVYRWNRPCYGVCDGKAHLRIENRVLPSGPTVVDSIANAAFWFGLMGGLAGEYGDIAEVMDFDDVKGNFLAASRHGLHAQFDWLEKHPIPARELICRRLLPLARDGLQASGIDSADIDRYLGIIEARVSSGLTGSQWMLNSLAKMKNTGTEGERLSSLTRAMIDYQDGGRPAHEWPLAELYRGDTVKRNFQTIEQYMSTDLITIGADDSVDLAANLMVWKKVRYLPVEDSQHRLAGLVTYRQLLEYLGSNRYLKNQEPVAIETIMEKKPIAVTPETSTLDAIRLMRNRKVSCLPVVKGDRLIGIVTDFDFLNVAVDLVERELQ